MQTVDDKIDAAVHAAMYALGLSVENYMDLAMSLNDWLYENTKECVTSDLEEGE